MFYIESPAADGAGDSVQVSENQLLVVLTEEGEALGQEVELLRTVELGHADSHAPLAASGQRQGDGAYAVEHKFTHKGGRVKLLVTDGVEEAVTHILVSVLVVDYMEAIVLEYLLCDGSTTGIFGSVGNKVKLSVRSSLEHSRQSILGRMADS